MVLYNLVALIRVFTFYCLFQVVDFAVGLAVRKGFLFDWGFQSRQSFSLESKQAVGTMMKLEPMVDFAPVGVLVEAAS